MKQYQDNKE